MSSKITVPPRLTEKQRKFCEVYISNGYKKTVAYQEVFGTEKKVSDITNRVIILMKKPAVVAEIERIEGEYRALGHEIGIDKRYVLNKIKEQIEAKKPIIRGGVLIGEVPDNAAINKALELLLKVLGDFSPEKKDLLIDTPARVDIADMTPAQREEYKKKLLREI